MTYLTADIINGFFQLGAAAGAWRNYWSLRKDRTIKGVYWPLYLLYGAWGLWDLIYYPVLGQWFSLATNAIIVSGNLAWLFLALRLRHGKSKA